MPTDLGRTAPGTTPWHHTMGLCLVEPRAPAKGPGVAWGTSTAFGSRGCGPGPSPGALSSPHLTCSPVNTNPFPFSLFLCSLLALQEPTARAATENKTMAITIPCQAAGTQLSLSPPPRQHTPGLPGDVARSPPLLRSPTKTSTIPRELHTDPALQQGAVGTPSTAWSWALHRNSITCVTSRFVILFSQ